MDIETLQDRIADAIVTSKPPEIRETQATASCASLVEEAWVQTLAHLHQSDDPIWKKIEVNELIPHVKVAVLLRVMTDSGQSLAAEAAQDLPYNDVCWILAHKIKEGLKSVLAKAFDRTEDERDTISETNVEMLLDILYGGAERALARFKMLETMRSETMRSDEAETK